MSPITVFTAPYSDDSRHSRELLRRAARILLGHDPGPVAQGQWGKPSFVNESTLHFSISHSGEFWLCAFSDRPVGIDIQCCKSFVLPEKLSRRFFHPAEDSFLARDGYERFYDLWTAKESFVKFTGRGFFDDPGSFSVVGEGGAFPSAPDAQLRHIPFREGYSVCVCSDRLGEIVFRESP